MKMNLKEKVNVVTMKNVKDIIRKLKETEIMKETSKKMTNAKMVSKTKTYLLIDFEPHFYFQI